MPTPPSEKGKSHEDLIDGSKLNLETWDPALKIYLTRRVLIFHTNFLGGGASETETLFAELKSLGLRILIVPYSDRDAKRKSAMHSTVVQCRYPFDFKEALVEISNNHETMLIGQEGIRPQHFFIAHLAEKDGITFDLVSNKTLLGGIRTPSPLRVVLKR